MVTKMKGKIPMNQNQQNQKPNIVAGLLEAAIKGSQSENSAILEQLAILNKNIVKLNSILKGLDIEDLAENLEEVSGIATWLGNSLLEICKMAAVDKPLSPKDCALLVLASHDEEFVEQPIEDGDEDDEDDDDDDDSDGDVPTDNFDNGVAVKTVKAKIV